MRASARRTHKMFRFQTCENIPEQGGGRWYGGGGLMEMEGRVVWGRGGVVGVYWLDEKDQWKRWTNGVEVGATLGVCGGRLVAVGGWKGGVYSKEVMVWREERWSLMSDMLVGCRRSCVVSDGRGGLVVMGGQSDGGSYLAAVQVFDDKTQTWHFGPSLPEPCGAMSAVVHGNLVFVMGGAGMARTVWCANINDLNRDKHQSPWKKLPDVPYRGSSVCVVDGVLLAIGGNSDESKDTSAICAFHPVDQKWQHIGEMPFDCSWVDSLLLSDGRLLVVDGSSQSVLRITVEGLAALFPKVHNTDQTRLYEEAMTKGYVETSVTKCLILGAAGVGKTHLKHLLLKKDPPKQRVSTGLADNPVRAISFSLAGVGGHEEDDWFVVEDDQALMSVIGGTIKGGVSMAPSLADVVSTLPKMAISVPSDGAGVSHSDPIPDVNTIMDTTQQSRAVDIEDELIHHINNSSSDKKKLFGVKWIHFIDSGGQLQYHDILPLFVQNTSVTIFVLKLSEELSHHPTIEYYGADGKPVGKPYKSSLSHKQILQHCLGAIHSHNARPLIVTVGTHRDAESECSESIKEKNQQLKALMAPAHFCVLYTGEGMDELLFAVNSLSPEDVDRHVAQVLRKEIVSKFPQQLVKRPIAWFGLEIVLQRSSHDGILSLVECQVCAKRLHIEGDAFSAALHHLVYHNVFLYYPEVLPQTVFCDPQVVLTKVTELVQYQHKLRNNPDKRVAVTGDWNMFRDHGLLSVELLRKFPKHYKEGLFTRQDLLELLVSVHVIAMIRDGEYLMPALLPHLGPDQVSKYYQQSTSLIIRPTQGYIPSGLFCCLVAHLLSSINTSLWKVCMERDKPLCLYRNCISFEQRTSTEIVTLVDMFSHIALHVDKASNKVCREIRGIVHSGIKSACSVLKYSHVQFEDAFMCAGACCTSDPPHVAVVISHNKWKCTILGRQSGDLSEDQLMWLHEGVVKSLSSAPISLDSEPSLPNLMDKIAAVIPHKYETVGLQLGLTLGELQVIGPRHPSLEDHHRAYGEMFGLWRRRGSPPYTWRTIIGVLRCASVGEVLLSDDLTSWITK